MASLLKYYPISESDRKAINSKYNKSQSDIENYVRILKEWLKKQPHIPEIQDDIFLQVILLRNKFRIEKTKLKIDKYFSTKTVYADLFLSIDPLDEDLMFVDSFIKECVMPKLSPCGSRVFFLTLLPLKDHNDFRTKDVFKYLLMRVENHLLLDYTDSVIMIVNCENATMSLVPKVQLSDIIKFINIFFEGFSARLSSVHALNTHPAVDILLNMAKPVIPSKIKNRIHLYPKGSEKIFDLVPRECLPSEYGGNGPILENLSNDYAKDIQIERDYIATRNKLCSQEELRIGKPTISMDLFGMNGTFKKINID